MPGTYFNDAPIAVPQDDRFGIDHFAQAIAASVKKIKCPIGVTIAISGPWGSGKTSAVNLIRHHLRDCVEKGQLDIVDFKCWWYRGEEALTLAFLQELNGSLQKSLGDRAKEVIPRIGKVLLQAGPVVGPAMNLVTGGIWSTLTTGSMDFVKRYFSDGDNVEKLFAQLSTALTEQNKQFLVVIDDIDRLAPNEALLIFRLVKSVGRLPNIMYLLVFDRELAEKAVAQFYPSEGPHFLEKIVQASFELPLPNRDDLNDAALSQIGALCGPIDEVDLKRFMNVFYDAIAPYLRSPRDLTRLANAMTVTWPAISGEVDVADYVALETMRLFEPSLYNAIRTNKKGVCGARSEHSQQGDREKAIEALLKGVRDKHRDDAKLALMRLFPRFENVGYAISFVEGWEAKRLVCTEKHFDTYFRLSVGDETLPAAEVEEFVTRAGDSDYVKGAFHRALGSIRRNGKSKVPLLLDEANAHASRIAKGNVSALISAIFEMADDINRREDRGQGDIAFIDNHLRIHWLIRRLTLDRCDLEERTRIFMAACEKAQLGWLVNFVTSAIASHCPHEGRETQPPEKCLVNKECLSELSVRTVKAIKVAASTGSLLAHPDLAHILFEWAELAGDEGAGVRAWTASELRSDESVGMLARAFTGESWSHGLGWSGALGDRVAMRDVTALVDGLKRVVDVHTFRQRLEQVEGSAGASGDVKRDVTVFLEAWRKRERGR